MIMHRLLVHVHVLTIVHLFLLLHMPYTMFCFFLFFFFFFNDTATTEIYTLSLHDALPILRAAPQRPRQEGADRLCARGHITGLRSEEHTSELQSRENLVCRLLLEKKKKKKKIRS